jgi:outer membrane protein TolC
MIRKAVILCLICIMSACSITPKPLTNSDRYQESIKDLKELFAEQVPSQGKLTFYEALARGLKYNLDYRIKRVNSALQAGQLDVAIYTMFPALNTSGSLYNRNNEYASSGITTTGAPTDILNSTPNTIRSSRVALSWNILDFGLGYVKAKQQGERYLIAQEEARKQIQQLSQDVLIAYWSAYSAQELMMEAQEFKSILTNAKKKLSEAMLDKTIPKQSILDYEGALLDGNRRIIQLQYKYDKAVLDLKHLLNLPPGLKLTLSKPPLTLRTIHDLSQLDFRKVDALTLVNRPELRGQNYQQRIAKWGVKTVILQSLPGITLNEGWNYNSNQFLLNTMWVDRSVDLAWNLLNVASLPASFKAADTQVEYEKLKLMALTLTALTETRYAYSHYETLRSEYNVAHKQTENAEAIFKLDKDRSRAALASDQQVIVAKLHTLTAKMDEDLLLSDLSTSLGELYSSVGLDILPIDLESRPLDEITKVINKNFAQQTPWDFSSFVNFSYNKIFNNNNIQLASNDVSENKTAVLDTVNSISEGTPADPVGMGTLSSVSKKDIPEKRLPLKTATQLAVKKTSPVNTEPVVKSSSLKLNKNTFRARLDGSHNLKILKSTLSKTADQKRIASIAHESTQVTKKNAAVLPWLNLKTLTAQIKPKPSDKTFVTALLSKPRTIENKISSVSKGIAKQSKVSKTTPPVLASKKAPPKPTVKSSLVQTKLQPLDKTLVTALLSMSHTKENKMHPVSKTVSKQPIASKPTAPIVASKKPPLEPKAKKLIAQTKSRPSDKTLVTALLTSVYPKKNKVISISKAAPKKLAELKTDASALVRKKVSTAPPEEKKKPQIQANKILVTALLSAQSPEDES